MFPLLRPFKPFYRFVRTKSASTYLPQDGRRISPLWLKRFTKYHEHRRKVVESGKVKSVVQSRRQQQNPWIIKLLKQFKIGTASDPILQGEGEQRVAFGRNLLHLSATRFAAYQWSLPKLTVEEAVLQARWHQRRTGRMMESILWQAWKKCAETLKLNDEDISNVVVSQVRVLPQALVSKRLKLRGQGPYGATPHPKTGLIIVELAHFDNPEAKAQFLAKRFSTDGVNPNETLIAREQIRMRLREWMKTKEEVENGRVSVPTDIGMTVDESKRLRAKPLPPAREIPVYH